MKLFGKKKNNTPKGWNVEARLLYGNYVVDDIYAACTACYDNAKPNISFKEKINYITKRIKAGHDSVTEHGFVTMIISGIPNDELAMHSINNLRDACQYLRVFSATLEDDTISLLVGGSVRGYRHLIKTIYDREDILFEKVMYVLNHTLTKDLFIDLLEDDSLIPYDLRNFLEVPDISICTGGHKYITTENGDVLMTDECDCDMKPIIIDNPGVEIFDYITYGEYLVINNVAGQYGFTYKEISEVIPVSILFKNMSRTATHQLVRHRNAITQESQRYVDYSKAPFTTPVDDDKEYLVTIFGTSKKITLEDLGKELCTVYQQLINQGLKKEEARAYLPSNVQCKRLYMTFTLSSLNKFLELRTDPHAQSEIRSYATAIKNSIYNNELLLRGVYYGLLTSLIYNEEENED